MMYRNNFFVYGVFDGELDDFELYGYDLEGFFLLEEINNVVVELIVLNNRDFMEFYVLDMIDFLM